MLTKIAHGESTITREAIVGGGEFFLKATYKIVALFAAVALLVVLGVLASFWGFNQVKDSANARKHTFEVIHSANELLMALLNAETGQRGYLLTGNKAFLEPYSTGCASIKGHLQELRQFTSGSAAYKQLDALPPLIDAKLAEMSQVIELRRHNHDMPAVIATVINGHGKRLMDSFRVAMSRFIQLEEDALTQQDAEFQLHMRQMFILIATASLFALLFALFFAYLIYRETQHRFNNLVHRETQHRLELQQELNTQLQLSNVTLQASEEKLAVTLNSIGDAVIATDAAGCVTLLNPLAEQLTGWTLAAATGHPVEDIFHIVNQETRQLALIPVTETLARGTVHGLANHTVLIALDGSECAIADSCAPIRDRDGKVVGAVLVFRDVTEGYAVQQALRNQQFYTRSLFESNIDAIMTTDPSGIITDVNKQMEVLTGCTRDELIGAPFTHCFTDPERAEASIKLVLSEKKITNYELTARAIDGKETVVSYNATTFYNRERKLQGMFAAARDITELKRFEQTLQQNNLELENAKTVAEKANLAKSDFLSSMSHELRSPLNAILGFAQLMESDSPPPSSSQQESIGQILQAGWHLLTLINEILDLAKIESGKLSLSLEPVSVAEVMLECQSIIESQAQQRGISMTFPPFDTLCVVHADRTRLKQVLINLLSNATKYNKAHGTVVVDCFVSAPERIRISVQDTGEGLSPDKLAQLFQPFNRLGQETHAEEGTGIGLVVAKQLVELMGGIIGVESTVGVGSAFWIELSADVAPQLAVEEEEPGVVVQEQVPNGARLRVLLYVEDNPANLKLVEQLIARRPDLRLLTAVNGSLGIELARSEQPEIILLDINLPDINGLAVLKKLREDPTTSHIPIVALSANAMPRDIEKGLAAGFFRYLSKPIKINEFMDTLHVALEFAENGGESIPIISGAHN